MQTMTKKSVESVQDLLAVSQHSRDHFGSKGVLKWFRGQPADCHLVPKVHRGRTKDEGVLLTRFLEGSPLRYGESCPMLGDYGSWLSLAQHYGLPTRLLDWSVSILVAAHFAVADEGHDGDAKIWAINPGGINRLYHPNRKPALVPLISAIGNEIAQRAFNDGADQAHSFVAVTPQTHDMRVLVQQSMFTCHDTDAPLDGHHPDLVSSWVIPADSRETIKDDLEMLGVSHGNLFPDLHGLSRQLISTNFM